MKNLMMIIVGVFCLNSTNLYASDPCRETRNAVVQQLCAGRLADNLDISSSRAKRVPISDVQNIASWKIESAPSHKGIPDPVNPSPNPSDVIFNAFSLVESMGMTLNDSQELPMGERLFYLHDEAIELVKRAKRVDEVLAHVTLNRSIDVFNHIAEISGRNYSLIAQGGVSFFNQSYILAAGLANNFEKFKLGDETAALPENFTFDQVFDEINFASYSLLYARLLFDYQNGFKTNAASAVILIRLVNFLANDFNTHDFRRDRSMRKVIALCFRLQRSPKYKKLLSVLALDQDPTVEQVGAFRYEVKKLLNIVPKHLAAAGVNVMTVNRVYNLPQVQSGDSIPDQLFVSPVSRR